MCMEVFKARYIFGFALFFVLFFVLNSVFAAAPLDQNLKPDQIEEISSVFRDMGVVQKKAMNKSGRFLLSSYGSFDFSDGPYTNYSINMNPGYAINDYFEIYANVVPTFIVQARSIVKKVSDLQLIDGTWASISAARPKLQFGAEVLWAPFYGKDSFGIRKVVRSDTFFKFGGAQIQYDSDSGMKFVLGFGKTFFLSKWLGMRVCVDYSMIQTIVDNVKSYRSMVFLEGGLVVYL